MTVTVRFREEADRDVEAAIDHYLVEAHEGVARRFVDELARTVAVLGEQPSAGSPRYSYELDIPGLRFVRLGRFPYLVFYREALGNVDVWRVLHARRDIPSWLADHDL